MGSPGDWTRTYHAVMLRWPEGKGGKITSRRYPFNVDAGTTVEEFKLLLAAELQRAEQDLQHLIAFAKGQHTF
jgi:hypothetical protein